MILRRAQFAFGTCLLLATLGACGARNSEAAQQVNVPANATGDRNAISAPNPDAASQVGDQTSDPPAKPAKQGTQTDPNQFTETTLGLPLIKNIVADQVAIWTSPFHLKVSDADWLVPFAGITAASIAADSGISRAIDFSPSRASESTTFSNYGLGALGGITGGMYLWGKMTHDDHRSETGLLSGEAAVDALGVTTVLGYAFGRQRPTDGHGGGGFWDHGTSFPSDHSAAAWAMASVIAHEYPGPLTQIFAYGLASAISAARVTGRDHFPTDVLVGAGIGWLIGRHVFLSHHDPDLGGSEWGLPFEDEGTEASKNGLPNNNAGSTFVPLDSWVYPAFSRLAAMGLATSALQGLKPWTRIECARLTEEVSDALVQSAHNNGAGEEQAIQLDEALKREFAQEIAVLNGGRNLSFAVDSVYSRVTSISGPVLTQGFNLGGQTISYDFGRPFERGTNTVDGASIRATEGPLAVYARLEYQHSPAAPPLPADALQFISSIDGLPLQAPRITSTVNRADLLEGYVGFDHDGWQVSAGKQALSWNVGEGGSMLLSDNAEPLYMVRLTRVIPTELPGFLRFLGHFRTEWFLAKDNGGPDVPHPLLYAQKLSFNVTSFLEVGYGRTAILGRGPGATNGDAFTSYNFIHSFLGLNTSVPGANIGVPGFQMDELDLNLDLPGLRHYASLYADLYERVVAVYIADPPIGAYRAGIYFHQLPRLRRMDLRLEGTSSEAPVYNSPLGGDVIYFDSSYRGGYTNFGELMGNTVGRQGRIFQGWTTIHLSALNQIQFSFLDHQVDPHFMVGGALWQDSGVSIEAHARSGFYAKTMFQFEHIQHFPLLFNGPVNNVTASIELGFFPGRPKQ